MLLGKLLNQIVFVYQGPLELPILPWPQTNEGTFCGSLEYLSPNIRTFVQRYFYRCHWKGKGLRWYEQGPRYTFDIHYQLPNGKTGLGSKNRNQGVSNFKITELESKSTMYENLYEVPKWMINHEDIEYEALFLGGLFSDVSINMVEITKICDNLTPQTSFDWFGSDEFETIGLEDSSSSSSYLLVDQETMNFTLIPE